MTEVQKGYKRIRQENNVPEPTIARKFIKNLPVDTINDIEFHQPKRVNEPALISSKKLRDISIDSYEDGFFSEQNVECIFKAANILRRAILGSSKWEFKGSFTDNDTQVPYIQQKFFRWLLIGPKETLGSDQRYELAQQRVMRLAQSTISQCISERQARLKSSASFRKTRITPQEIAAAVVVRQSFRSKKVINVPSHFNVRKLYLPHQVRKQDSNTVLEKMIENGGNYIPHDFVTKRHIFFAVDNVDFQEDTMSGKVSLHGTSMAIYQQIMPEYAPSENLLSTENTTRSLKRVPDTITPLLDCNIPKNPPPQQPIYHSQNDIMSPPLYSDKLNIEVNLFMSKAIL